MNLNTPSDDNILEFSSNLLDQLDKEIIMTADIELKLKSLSIETMLIASLLSSFTDKDYQLHISDLLNRVEEIHDILMRIELKSIPNKTNQYFHNVRMVMKMKALLIEMKTENSYD
jgi:hypothetical protein